jgi:type IV pilus assembly protein PilV
MEIRQMDAHKRQERGISGQRAACGFSMIEILIALLIAVVGLLGLAGLQLRMQTAEFESFQRAQALVLLQDMVDRLQLHRTTASCFRFTDGGTGSPFLGTGSTFGVSCSASNANDNAEAVSALNEWQSALRGASETRGGTSVGAMVGARGCVSYDATTELPDAGGAAISGTGLYTVAVAWQGTIDTAASSVNCGNGLYGSEPRRRVVSQRVRLGYLR